MTRTSSRGKCKRFEKRRSKKDGGYIFISTLLLLATVATFFGILSSFEKMQMNITEKKVGCFYQSLERNNLEIQAEAKNAVE